MVLLCSFFNAGLGVILLVLGFMGFHLATMSAAVYVYMYW